MVTKVSFRVRYQETDKMGIVHHSVYFIWFEAGRTEWLRERGLTYRECEEKGWLMPVIESGAQYLSPARYDDLITVEVELALEKGAGFRFEYTVRNAESGKVLASGFTKHVCVGLDHKINKEATRYLKDFFARGAGEQSD